MRFDQSRAISQDLPSLDLEGRETDQIINGLGTLYTWNLWSPRLGVTAKLTSDGRTMLRTSYGRFSAGVLTGELEFFHPGAKPVTTTAWEPASGGYTRVLSVVDNQKNLRLDPNSRAPHTDEFSIGLDRELGRRLAVSVAYVRKDGGDFTGWTDVGGQYRAETRAVSGGTIVPVFLLTNTTGERLFLLTNPVGYSLTYNGLVTVVEKRRSNGWQALGSYTWSRTDGLQASSGTSAAGAQVSTVSPPQPLTFGRDPNDLTNAAGRLPGDRPHIARVMGSVDVPKTGVAVSANLQYYLGKPWAASAVIPLPQNMQQRVLLEPRGSRRLSSQTLLDLRVLKAVPLGSLGRVELIVDVLNVLNSAAEEGIASDVLGSPTFAQPIVFVDPRRAMISARINVGR